jgi:glycosyltransferase involved in cell wall biosynthesis
VPNDAILLLYAGRISPEKNVGLLPPLMKILRERAQADIRLLVAGAGPKAEWLAQEAERSCPGAIVQLGHLEKRELADLYANCDIFVHPNPREPFGIAPLEAMASGIPTVAPRSGGILSYADDDNAWLCEPTPEQFCDAVLEVISDPELRSRKVANALATARANTREASTDNLLSTYDEIYADFQSRRELFTDINAVRNFNFVELTR